MSEKAKALAAMGLVGKTLDPVTAQREARKRGGKV